MSKDMLAWTGEYDDMTSPVMQLCKRAGRFGTLLNTLLVHASSAAAAIHHGSVASGPA